MARRSRGKKAPKRDTKCRLLLLPAEIRTRIFKYYAILQRGDDDKRALINIHLARIYYKLILNASLTNRLLFTEIRAIFLGNHVFHFEQRLFNDLDATRKCTAVIQTPDLHFRNMCYHGAEVTLLPKSMLGLIRHVNFLIRVPDDPEVDGLFALRSLKQIGFETLETLRIEVVGHASWIDDTTFATETIKALKQMDLRGAYVTVVVKASR